MPRYLDDLNKTDSLEQMAGKHEEVLPVTPQEMERTSTFKHISAQGSGRHFLGKMLASVHVQQGDVQIESECSPHNVCCYN